MNSINPLFSLVEAAQLVGQHNKSSATTSSTSSILSGQQVSPRTHEVSDDDTTIVSKMIALRETHLMALRAAATSAGLQQTLPPQTASLTPAKATTTQPQRVSRRVTMALDESSGGKETFPMKLHALLADSAVCDIISWLPQGKSFVVLRPDMFASRVLPRYFAPEGSNSLNARQANGKEGSVNKAQGVHKYPSFTRKLNRWGFRQISRGPDAGAFCHELFQRDDPELCRGMVCQKSRKSKQAITERLSMKSDASDLISLSSFSTKSTSASGEKTNNCSAATVCTEGVSTASFRSLPFKKRRTFGCIENAMDEDIPSVVTHRNSSYKNSISSGMVAQPDTSSGSANCVSTEVFAKEALARHFHEQHTAFALAALMENSRLAMEAAGLKVSASQLNDAPTQVVIASTPTKPIKTSARKQQSPILGATTDSALLVPTVPQLLFEHKNSSYSSSSAAAAKDALYNAYMQALNGTTKNNE